MGIFRLNNKIILRNTLVAAGEDAFLRMLLWGDNTIVNVGANFYLGLCGQAFDVNTILSTLVGEPAVAHNYSRQGVPRSAAGWPTTGVVNGKYRYRTVNVVFSASGGNYDVAIRRVFLCSVAAGTVGTLFAVSEPLTADYLVTPANPLTATYEFHL